jgi:hypothetical protein
MGIITFNQIKKTLIVLNVLCVFFYSPNFISQNFPFIKVLQLLILGLTLIYLMNVRLIIDTLSVLLHLFACFVVLSSYVNYIRFGNIDSIYMSMSYMCKVLNVVLLFRMIESRKDFDLVLRAIVFTLGVYAVHGVFQFLLVALVMIEPKDNIEWAGYEYYNLGLFGIYRVAMVWDGWYLIRAQSFFQEPGFFAFYLMFGVLLVDLINDRMSLRFSFLLATAFILAMLLTMSLTGNAIMLSYFILKTRSKLFKIILIVIAVTILNFIVFNESKVIAKAGSFMLRLEHYALLGELAESWENFLFGIGLGNDVLFSEMRVNNFLPELVMYSSVFGFILMAIAIVMTIRGGGRSKHIVLMACFYSLSTPMLWSPLFLIALYIARRIQIERLQVSAIGGLSLQRQI